jgi:hypothetical protein
LKIATDVERKNVPLKLKARDKVSIGVIAPPGFDKNPFTVALIEQAGKATKLFVDLNRDKKFNRRERFSLKPSEAKKSDFDGSITIEIPLRRWAVSHHCRCQSFYRSRTSRNPSSCLVKT